MPENTPLLGNCLQVLRFIEENRCFFTIPIVNKMHSTQAMQAEYSQKQLNHEDNHKVAYSKQEYDAFCALYKRLGCSDLLADYTEKLKQALKGPKISMPVAKGVASLTTPLSNAQVVKSQLLLWEQGFFHTVIKNNESLRAFILSNKRHPAILLYKADQLTLNLVDAINGQIQKLDNICKNFGNPKHIEDLKVELKDLKMCAIMAEEDFTTLKEEYRQIASEIEFNSEKAGLIEQLNLFTSFIKTSEDFSLMSDSYPKAKQKLKTIMCDFRTIVAECMIGSVNIKLAEDLLQQLYNEHERFLTSLSLMKSNHASIQAKIDNLEEYKIVDCQEVKNLIELLHIEQRRIDSLAIAENVDDQEGFLSAKKVECCDRLQSKLETRKLTKDIVAALTYARRLAELLKDKVSIQESIEPYLERLGEINSNELSKEQKPFVIARLRRLLELSIRTADYQLQNLACVIRESCVELQNIDARGLLGEDRQKFEDVRSSLLSKYSNCVADHYQSLKQPDVDINEIMTIFSKIRNTIIEQRALVNRCGFFQTVTSNSTVDSLPDLRV